MPRRPTQQPVHGVHAHVHKYLQWMQVHGYSPRSLEARRSHLHAFAAWCDLRSILEPAAIDRPILERYQKHLFHYCSPKTGEQLAVRSQSQHLVSVRTLFKWLTRQRIITHNPASELELPRVGKPLPKHVLTASEAETILNLPDVHTLRGQRDRAILELLYSSGIRRMELVQLGVFDIDFNRGVIGVRHGKGNRDRFVPLGERAAAWLRKYLFEARPQLQDDPAETALFLSNTGQRFSPSVLGHLVHDYVAAAELTKTGSCHLFRHTMATAMFEGGADVRDIQAILGHVSLDATAIYTRVGIERLRRVHEVTHPASRLKPLAKTHPSLAAELDDDA